MLQPQAGRQRSCRSVNQVGLALRASPDLSRLGKQWTAKKRLPCGAVKWTGSESQPYLMTIGAARQSGNGAHSIQHQHVRPICRVTTPVLAGPGFGRMYSAFSRTLAFGSQTMLKKAVLPLDAPASRQVNRFHALMTFSIGCSRVQNPPAYADGRASAGTTMGTICAADGRTASEDRSTALTSGEQSWFPAALVAADRNEVIAGLGINPRWHVVKHAVCGRGLHPCHVETFALRGQSGLARRASPTFLRSRGRG